MKIEQAKQLTEQALDQLIQALEVGALERRQANARPSLASDPRGWLTLPRRNIPGHCDLADGPTLLKHHHGSAKTGRRSDVDFHQF
jgi:hypothetical protein